VLDLVLAIVHHLLVFGLAGILFAELMLVRPGMDLATVGRVARMDLVYGAFAGLVIVVGLVRAGMAAKGWAYYSHNAFFWAKLAVFLLVGLLSAPPTIAFIRWRKAGAAPDSAQVSRVRRFLHAEVALFALLPIFAAAMARGYGQF
jgi:putative membrane protein